jgi:hypothetical protein
VPEGFDTPQPNANLVPTGEREGPQYRLFSDEANSVPFNCDDEHANDGHRRTGRIREPAPEALGNRILVRPQRLRESLIDETDRSFLLVVAGSKQR